MAALDVKSNQPPPIDLSSLSTPFKLAELMVDMASPKMKAKYAFLLEQKQNANVNPLNSRQNTSKLLPVPSAQQIQEKKSRKKKKSKRSRNKKSGPPTGTALLCYSESVTFHQTKTDWNIHQKFRTFVFSSSIWRSLSLCDRFRCKSQCDQFTRIRITPFFQNQSV